MRISAHTYVTNPQSTGYAICLPAIQSFLDFADEVIVVDGGSDDGSLEALAKLRGAEKLVVHASDETWWGPGDAFSRAQFGIQRQAGYERCTGDWAIAFDADHVLHEREHAPLRRALEERSAAGILYGFDLVECANAAYRPIEKKKWWCVNRRLALATGSDLVWGLKTGTGGNERPVRSEKQESFLDPVRGTRKHYWTGRAFPESGLLGVALHKYDHFFFDEAQLAAKLERFERMRARWEQRAPAAVAPDARPFERIAPAAFLASDDHPRAFREFFEDWMHRADTDVIGLRRHATPPARIALFVTDFASGGVETTALEIATRLRTLGFEVDLVVCSATGPLARLVPSDVRVFELGPASELAARLAVARADVGGIPANLRPILLPRMGPHRLRSLPGLAAYLRERRPDGLYAATPVPNLLAVWARRLAGVSTRVVVSQRNHVSSTLASSRRWRKRFLAPALGRGYALADGVVAVSRGVADDLAAATGLARERIRVVYNPVVNARLAALAKEPLDHPWLQPGEPPVVLSVGRLVEQKDYPFLVRAFARLREARPARLVILGEAQSAAQTRNEREALLALARELGVGGDVSLPGYVTNPFAFLARASVFALTSRFEGLSNALIQALACGCPVVSVDCPHGPAEILDGGAYGTLVRLGDEAGFAAALAAAIDAPVDRERLRERAAYFSVDRAVDAYLELLLGSRASSATPP
jgi:glycosyltransferase involved in cell wall biosynthesis